MGLRKVGTDGPPLEVGGAVRGMGQLNDGSWVNAEVKPITHVKCFVPLRIQYLMEDINDLFRNTEFSVYLKYEEVEEGIMIGDDFIIPNQEVSLASVDYKEGAPTGYDCVAHKHPNGMDKFSNTDETYINSNFNVSLLWTSNKGFVYGHVRAKTQYGYVKIPIEFDLEVNYRDVIVSADMVKSKIRPIVVSRGSKRKYGKNAVNHCDLDAIRANNQKRIEELWGDDEFTIWGENNTYIDRGYRLDDGSGLIDIDDGTFAELTSGYNEIKGKRENDPGIDWNCDGNKK